MLISKKTFPPLFVPCFSTMSSHFQRYRDSGQLLKASRADGQPSERESDRAGEGELHDRTFVCVMCSGNETAAQRGTAKVLRVLRSLGKVYQVQKMAIRLMHKSCKTSQLPKSPAILQNKRNSKARWNREGTFVVIHQVCGFIAVSKSRESS